MYRLGKRLGKRLGGGLSMIVEDAADVSRDDTSVLDDSAA